MVGLSLAAALGKETTPQGRHSFENHNQQQPARIDFVPSVSSDTVSAAAALQGIDFLLLNAATPSSAAPASVAAGAPDDMRAGKKQAAANGDGGSKRKAPSVDDPDPLQMQWASVRRTGAGLVNLGNTCFMNSVLQCLIHTPPLAERCLSRERLPGSSGGTGTDLVQMTQDLVVRSLSGKSRSMPPSAHARSLRVVSKSFRPGRQEDAHEYLRCLLDGLHERCLKSLNKGKAPAPGDKKLSSTLFGRIFGGRLCSQVKCMDCKYESNTFEEFLDLSLEIAHASTVQRALERFTAAEILQGSNKYKCPKTNTYVKASKRMCIDAPPNVLTLQLKRFEFGGFGRKINKKVDFETSLDLTPFVRVTNGTRYIYDLYAVLVHAGNSVRSGHYYCYVKGPSGVWNEMDDSMVSEVSEKKVLAQKAYILFYARRVPKASPRAPMTSASKACEKKKAPAAAAAVHGPIAEPQAVLPRSFSAPASASPRKVAKVVEKEAKATPSTSSSLPQKATVPSAAPEISPAEKPGTPPTPLRIPLHRTVTLPCSPLASPLMHHRLALPFGLQQRTSSNTRFQRLQRLQSGFSAVWYHKQLRKQQRKSRAAAALEGSPPRTRAAKRARDCIRSPVATRGKQQRLVQPVQ